MVALNQPKARFDVTRGNVAAPGPAAVAAPRPLTVGALVLFANAPTFLALAVYVDRAGALRPPIGGVVHLLPVVADNHLTWYRSLMARFSARLLLFVLRWL